MKRLAALSIVCLLLFSSCIPGDSAYLAPIQPGTEEGSGLLDAAVIAVDVNSPAFRDGAGYFGNKLRSILPAAGAVSVHVADDPLSSLRSGQAQFAFLDLNRYQGQDSAYAALCAPFLYRGYSHFAMAVNHENVLAYLNQAPGKSLDLVHLGGFSQNSRLLLASWHLDDWQVSGSAVAVDPNTFSGELFLGMGARVLAEEDGATRLELLRDGEVEVAEFTWMELSGLELTEAPRIINRTYHTEAPVMLVADAEFYNALTPGEQSAVQEAVSYLYAFVEKSDRQAGETYLQDLEVLEGFIVETEFDSLRREILDAWKRGGYFGTQETYLLGLIEDDT